MGGIPDNFGVQTYCLRGFKSNEQVAQIVGQLELASIELCGVHVDFDAPDTFDAAIEAYRGNNIEITCIGPERITSNEVAARHRFEFARLCGARFMSVDFLPGDVPACYRLAEKLADEYDVRLAIHNHGGGHWLGSAQMLEHVLGQTSPRIGLCLDTAWALDAGDDPIEMARRFGERLYGVHIKDFVFDQARKPEDVVVGRGNLDLAALQRVLDEVDFQGYAVLEYEGDVDNPVAALHQCVEAVRQLG